MTAWAWSQKGADNRWSQLNWSFELLWYITGTVTHIDQSSFTLVKQIPWCFWSAGCPAPAGTCGGPFPADWPHPSASWWRGWGLLRPGTSAVPRYPPRASDWTGLDEWWAAACLWALRYKDKKVHIKERMDDSDHVAHLIVSSDRWGWMWASVVK